ncbi:MAG: PadR family transcriptional regulator [Deltaproteobacteria bacterium]|nr:PadR family transcriptional regulator [Deltaproteobacteria bacterium]
MTGYEIKQFIGESIGHFWSEGYGQIYPMLRKLADEGLIEGTKEESSTRPERTRFHITAAGRDGFEAWMQTPVTLQPMRNELLLRVFFGTQAPAGTLQKLLEDTMEAWKGYLDVYRGIEKMLSTQLKDSPSCPYWLMTVRQGIHQMEANLKWGRESQQTLQALANDK